MWGIVLRRALPVLVVAATGAVVLTLAGGSAAGMAVGLFLLGASGVLAASFVFLEVGLTEDRERASGARRRTGRGGDGDTSGKRAQHPGGPHRLAPYRPRRRRPE